MTALTTKEDGLAMESGEQDCIALKNYLWLWILSSPTLSYQISAGDNHMTSSSGWLLAWATLSASRLKDNLPALEGTSSWPSPEVGPMEVGPNEIYHRHSNRNDSSTNSNTKYEINGDNTIDRYSPPNSGTGTALMKIKTLQLSKAHSRWDQGFVTSVPKRVVKIM